MEHRKRQQFNVCSLVDSDTLEVTVRQFVPRARIINESICLEIQNDGRGIAADNSVNVQTNRSGVGITGMRERVRHLKGVMDIQSNSAGTTIAAKLPVSKNG